LEGASEELLVAVGGQGHFDGLAEAGDEFALSVVGCDVDFEGAVVGAVGPIGEGELFCGKEVLEAVAGEALVLEFRV
jgi:hypothetical protein